MSVHTTPRDGDAGDEKGSEDDLFEDGASVDGHDHEADDDGLWGHEDPPPPLNPKVIIGVAAALVVLVVGFLVFGGDDGGGSGGSVASGTSVPGQGGGTSQLTTQITSQQAPWGAKELSPTTLPPGAVPKGCGTWDGAFNGAPVELVDGVHIWSDFDGWHVRLVGPTVGSLTGAVRGQYLPALQSEATAPGVKVLEDEPGKRLAFDLAGGDQPVGFDFSAGCDQKEITFELTSEGSTVPFEHVHLGSKGVVEEFPLVARRTLPAAG